MNPSQLENGIKPMTTLPRVWEKSNTDSVSISMRKDDYVGFYVVERSAMPTRSITHKIAINPNTMLPELVKIDKDFSANTVEKEVIVDQDNSIVKEKFVTYATILDFSKIPVIWIDTPTFKFNSHSNGQEWKLHIKQRWFGNYIGKTVVKLIRKNAEASEPGIQIRLSGQAAKIRINNFEDIVTMFDGNFELVHSFTLAMTKPKEPVKNISSYSDEELLAEVHRRTMSRIGDYRGHQPVIDYTNVIDLDSVRRITFDESVVTKLLEEAA